MGAVYSVDLRLKVVKACERGTASQAEAAQFFGISVSFVEKLLRLHRRTGGFEPDRRRASRPAQIDAAPCVQVQRWLDEQNDLTLAELAERLQARCGLSVSISCVWRLMQRLHMRRKKDTPASERDTSAVLLARQQYRTQLAGCACGHLKFIDESGCNIAMTRRYGRAQYGRRVADAGPKNFGLNVTILGALSCTGLNAIMTVEGATDTAVFRAYVERVLVPTLVADDIVVMDISAFTKSAASEKPLKPPAPDCFTCRRTHRITHRLKAAGPSSRHSYERPRRGPGKHSMRLLRKRSNILRNRMQRAASNSMAMPYINSTTAILRSRWHNSADRKANSAFTLFVQQSRCNPLTGMRSF